MTFIQRPFMTHLILCKIIDLFKNNINVNDKVHLLLLLSVPCARLTLYGMFENVVIPKCGLTIGTVSTVLISPVYLVI